MHSPAFQSGTVSGNRKHKNGKISENRILVRPESEHYREIGTANLVIFKLLTLSEFLINPMENNLFKVSKITLEQRCPNVILLTLNRFLPDMLLKM